ncbi:40S ribosomal protein S18 [Batrachochytrium dendrobatidis JEL423]|uniref:40S ribosomal protein S18 n=1 Tax=Batrachochytrium dendrobatidis (strain JEL423) TaxID=403673 RepID=A0A177WCM6_BATDL|nr:40S ribosomal protein S18 [Batrachochytrium dendrobatidis JEL423]
MPTWFLKRQILISTRELVRLQTTSLSVSLLLCRTPVNTRFLTGSLTDKRTSRMVNTPRLLQTPLTTSFVRILNVSRRSVLIVVSVTTGGFVFVVSTPRPLAVVDAQSVFPRRRAKIVDQSSKAFQLCSIKLGTLALQFQ